MDASAMTMRHQVGTALVDDPGFPLSWIQPLNNPGERLGARSNQLCWSGKWRESRRASSGQSRSTSSACSIGRVLTAPEHVDARGSRTLTGAPRPCQRRSPA
jgi:hypothetical protein